MKDDSALISAAVLTAIWEKSKKDNIELIIPFINSILYNRYKIGDLIDEEYIIKELQEVYCFNNFPHAVLKVVLKRLRKDGIIKSDQKQYYLAKDLSQVDNSFKSSKTEAKTNINVVINAITDYLRLKYDNNVTNSDSEKYLGTFLSAYGYNAYKNVNTVYSIWSVYIF